MQGIERQRPYFKKISGKSHFQEKTTDTQVNHELALYFMGPFSRAVKSYQFLAKSIVLKKNRTSPNYVDKLCVILVIVGYRFPFIQIKLQFS